jgi:hypothetical protein
LFGRLMTVLAAACVVVTLSLMGWGIDWEGLPFRGAGVLLLTVLVGVACVRFVKPGVAKFTPVDRVLLWILYLLASYLLPAMLVQHIGARAEKLYESRECSFRAEILGRAMQMYVLDWDNVLPVAAGWCDSVSEYAGPAAEEVDPGFPWSSESPFVCPSAPALRCGYAFNSELSGVDLNALSDPHNTILLFESDAGWNAAGGADLLPSRPRHLRVGGLTRRDEDADGPVDTYVFADGHVEKLGRKRAGLGFLGWPIWVKEPHADRAIWEPVLKDSEGEQTAAPDP